MFGKHNPSSYSPRNNNENPTYIQDQTNICLSVLSSLALSMYLAGVTYIRLDRRYIYAIVPTYGAAVFVSTTPLRFRICASHRRGISGCHSNSAQTQSQRSVRQSQTLRSWKQSSRRRVMVSSSSAVHIAVSTKSHLDQESQVFPLAAVSSRVPRLGRTPYYI